MKARKVVKHILTYGSLLVLCMCTSCGSLYGRMEEDMSDGPKNIPVEYRIYPGLQVFINKRDELKPEVLWVVDLPFDFAFDTLMLPFDILGIDILPP